MSLHNKILIANRGEIAVRIIRAARELNIKTVSVYSNVDKDSLHVMLADEAVCIGDHHLNNSYLNESAILQAAINCECDAIHPGYGFLSESAAFAKKCEQIGIAFIGPKSETINLMGDKQRARDTMLKAKVPITPGSKEIVDSLEKAYVECLQIGYPVLIKATAGGGGKGMRICYREEDLEHAYTQAQAEALNAFNNKDVYIEKFIENPRHIEVQIMADKFSNVVHLFERECSVQRSNQKLIEEAPVANISNKTKEKLYDVAIKAAKAIKYQSLGTIEFIMDKDENFYFIEMNTRVQVEHPITEMITGIDLIKEQIKLSSNQKLSYTQNDIKLNGHSIEIRINAEDPYENFKPNAGLITALHVPGGNGVRVDSFIYQGYSIKPFYDSMIAKLIVHSDNREHAISKAINSLEELDILGIKVNIDFQLEVLNSDEFKSNNYNTSLVSKLLKE